MGGLILLVVIGTTIWVGVDASSLKSRGAQLSPANWVLGCLFLWIVGFPLYLVKRGEFQASATGALPAGGWGTPGGPSTVPGGPWNGPGGAPQFAPPPTDPNGRAQAPPPPPGAQPWNPSAAPPPPPPPGGQPAWVPPPPGATAPPGGSAQFCVRCGAGIVAGAKFCPACGAPTT